MRKIAPPCFTLNDVFNACVLNKNEPSRSNLIGVLPEAEQLETEYRAQAEGSNLFQLGKVDEATLFVGGKTELFKLYDERMAKNPSPGRAYYDQILNAGLPRCPYCNHNRPRQLDHMLPKEGTGYPELSLAPINLVPVCADCNFHKRAHSPTTYTDQFFHPYFDTPENVVWLSAYTDYTQNRELTITFDTITFPEYEAFSERVRFQFTVLKLNQLYSAQAATVLGDIRHGLLELFNVHGNDEVRNRIIEDHSSFHANDINSWRTAMYKCLVDDPHFCNMDWIL